MIGILLGIRLLFKVFSLKKGSLRRPSLKRLVVAFVWTPLFSIHLLINQFFMLLDEVFFPSFKKQSTDRMTFIVGVPRTATTFVFHTLAKDQSNFTAFKLWEIILAPSIIQKYFFAFWKRMDQNGIWNHIAAFFDKILFSALKDIHEMSLSKPEEDESILLYSLSSAYLYYVFPETKLLDPLIFFDADLPESKRKKVMSFYHKCVQRHNYVYNRNEERIFLSKNPTFTAKMKSLKEEFPKCNFLYMYRTPRETIPSTISLNKSIFSIFNSVKQDEYPLQRDIAHMVLLWYEESLNRINENPSSRKILIFDKVRTMPEKLFQDVYEFLSIPMNKGVQIRLEHIQKESSSFQSQHKYPKDLGLQFENVDIRIKEIESSFDQINE